MHADSDRPVSKQSKIPERILQQYVGINAIERNKGKPHIFKARGTFSPVTIGPWKFTTSKIDDAPTPQSGTNHSYFAIRAKHIVHEAEYIQQLKLTEGGREELASMEYDPEELIFGQFHRFVQLDIPFWSEEDSELRLGRCTLWRPIRPWKHDLPHHFCRTLQPAILDLRDSNIFFRKRQGRRKMKHVKYVLLKHIETIVAIGPMVQDLEDEDEERIYFAAMPLAV